MLVTRSPAGVCVCLGPVIPVFPKPAAAGLGPAIASPSLDQAIVNGGSPFSTMQVTWARTPSDRSLLKLKGAIVGGTAQKRNKRNRFKDPGGWGYVAQAIRADPDGRYDTPPLLVFPRAFGPSCSLSAPLLRSMIDGRLAGSKMFSKRTYALSRDYVSRLMEMRPARTSIPTCLGGIVFRVDFREY